MSKEKEPKIIVVRDSDKRIISYALDFLCANFDEGEEEDLKITHKELEEFVENWRNNLEGTKD